jgi:tellurite resistance protein TerC
MTSQFYVGHPTEYGLSLHNLFVFTDIMTWFAVPPARQPRVLLLGIGLALATCSALIVAGATALNHFGWLFTRSAGSPCGPGRPRSGRVRRQD